MKLYCYKKANVDLLTDQEIVMLWFLTTMFKVLGEEEAITIDKYDFVLMFTGDPRCKVKIEDLVEHELAKFFSFADLGPRYAVRIKEEVLAKRYAGRKLGTTKRSIKDEIPTKIAIYLHAALNLMDHWTLDEDINIFNYEPPTRFGRASRQHWTLHERFSVENIMGIDHVYGK